ncbi:RNA polymerase III subunit Rpc25-domain-containing protein [Lasiosphaeria miniovina]|uniref:DNA-directed RNA polymerase subunit n=1 Tax=Lasiosphaeria miniovina TaxID=1954250 RepID=A0AA39ZU44_9PEZI|nr:RNA polymerase III subunit Rpc25-domain-containing protein [Lasiosphaeria miniovina]KAK0703613.1 RNA polymerase III subunit Rpc25-domain-containing protein [Lasiosphaeria miniovina]
MFVLTKIADLVQIAPNDFGKSSLTAIEDNINAKYANKVVQKLGLFICLWDILWTSEGLIGHGTGLVNVNVEFRMVVFRPFNSEVMVARIASQSREGIHLATDFFHDIFVPYSELPDGTEFEPADGLWVWKEEDQQMYYDNNEMVRFQVISEEWHDQTPTGPVDAAEEPASSLLPPYKITGSMKGPGLGCYLWWED